jgi:hypothetical protein
MQDEAAAIDQEQWMMVLTALLLYREQLDAVPRWCDSRVGKAKNKNRHRLAGALLLESDYFAEDAANNLKKFWRHFWMNEKTFIKIVLDVREYDNYSWASQIARDYMGSHWSRNARMPYDALPVEHHMR